MGRADFNDYLNGHLLNDDDYFFSLPEEIQEQVNARAGDFKSHEEMREYIRDLFRRA